MKTSVITAMISLVVSGIMSCGSDDISGPTGEKVWIVLQHKRSSYVTGVEWKTYRYHLSEGDSFFLMNPVDPKYFHVVNIIDPLHAEIGFERYIVGPLLGGATDSATYFLGPDEVIFGDIIDIEWVTDIYMLRTSIGGL